MKHGLDMEKRKYLSFMCGREEFVVNEGMLVVVGGGGFLFGAFMMQFQCQF